MVVNYLNSNVTFELSLFPQDRIALVAHSSPLIAVTKEAPIACLASTALLDA